jgi:hypothetical protein
MTRFVKENSQIPKRSDEDRFVQRSSNKFQTLKTLNPSQKSWIRNRTKDHNIFSACVQKPDYMTTTVSGTQSGPRCKATVSPSFPTGSQSTKA